MLSDLDKVKCIAEHVGLQASRITPLGRGATSSAWKVTHGGDAFIIRFMPVGTPRPATYQSEFTVLRALVERECPVPRPVMASVEASRSLPGVPEAWAVTQVIPGEPVKNSPISSGLAYDLGRFLSILHALPVTGFGRLVEQPEMMMGQQGSPLEGVRARWCWADLWPFDGSELLNHPFSERRSDLIEKLQELEEEIFKAASDEPAVLAHSDLHGEHIFQWDGALSGVIDFGAVFIGVPAWDFAVIAFYYGWPVVQATMSGYTYPLGDRQLLQQTQMLALVVGLYKLSRAVKERASESKIERILQFLSRTEVQMDKRIKPLKALHGEIAVPSGEWNALGAAALVVAASSYARSDLKIQNVSLDPKGRRMLQVFRWMDARIETEKHRAESGSEPTGTLRVRGAEMRPTKVSGENAAMFLREIPVWAAAGAFTSGEMVIRDVAPLREGPADLLDVLVETLRKMGVRVGEMPDGIVVEGGRRPQGTEVDARGDGPLAMAFALLAFRAEGETLIRNADGLDQTWPGFVEALEALAARTKHEIPV